MEKLRLFMEKWESIWLFLVLFPEFLAGVYSAWILTKEYKYDENKDIEKRQRKTRTTKKTTTQPSGISTTEEVTETSEPMREINNER